jgi:hypothetical protein
MASNSKESVCIEFYLFQKFINFSFLNKDFPKSLKGWNWGQTKFVGQV